MHIKQIPSDIWSIVLNYIDGLNIISLLLCGNNEMNTTLLTAGVIKEFIIHFKQPKLFYPPKISQFFTLKKLVIDHDLINQNNVDWPKVIPYSFPPSLTHLKLGNLFISNDLIDHIIHLSSLKYLILLDVNFINDSHIVHLPRTLTHLDLSQNRILTDSCIEYLPKSLTYLNLRYNQKLTDLCIPHLPRSLNYLNLGYNKNLTDSSIKHLPRSLTYFNLFSNNSLTDSCIEHLPRSLTHFDLAFNNKFTNLCIQHLPISLTHLYLSKNTNITNSSSHIIDLFKFI